MGLPWVRLDTGFAQNPKVLELIEDKKWQSVVEYVGGLGYSGQHGLGGFLPKSALPFIHGTARTSSDLVNARLWVPCPGGWNINGWAEFQPDSDEAQDRSKRARHAAEVRWGKAGTDA